MSLKHQITTKSKLPDIVDNIFTDYYDLSDNVAWKVEEFISPLKRQCNFFIEYPYVDKVYRNSYYNFYSSKLRNYHRNCIRISVFTTKIKNEDFRSEKKFEAIKEHYHGFFVIRPTLPSPIGRTVLSPDALSDNNFLTCTTGYPTTCNGIKLNVTGFPYSSQNTETISCAETSLWSIAEYFGYKYALYKPLLPSDIVDILEKHSFERLLPSRGLDINRMSYVLKERGFGTRIYTRNSFKNFEQLFSTYVESGVPIVVEMDDVLNKKGNHVHALLCIGREKFNMNILTGLKKRDGLFDLDEAKKNFVFIDDNHSPYQLATLSKPAINYHKSWHHCKINAFIAPLYPKIYLDAFKAKKSAKTVLKNLRTYFKFDDIYFRFFLASSRSYKNYLALNNDLNDGIKNLIIDIPMPKFIWVGELLSKDSIENNKCLGLVIIDATESNNRDLKPLIFALYKRYIFLKGYNELEFFINREPLNAFDVYKGNLNGF